MLSDARRTQEGITSVWQRVEIGEECRRSGFPHLRFVQKPFRFAALAEQLKLVKRKV
jgi:hypothetical protein